MATTDNDAKRENRIWLSLRSCLMPTRKKLRVFYQDEDIYAEGVISLAKKHGCLPDISEEGSGGSASVEMDMHLHAPIQSSVKESA